MFPETYYGTYFVPNNNIAALRNATKILHISAAGTKAIFTREIARVFDLHQVFDR